MEAEKSENKQEDQSQELENAQLKRKVLSLEN